MKVLLTRPLLQSQAMAAKLLPAGIVTLICPMTTIKPISFSLEPEQIFQGIILTSGRAVQLFSQQYPQFQALPLYIVGQKTALIAQQNGYQHIKIIAHNVAELVQWLQLQPEIRQAHLLYVSGQEITADLCILLQEYCVVQQLAVYKAEAIEALPDVIKSALCDHSLEAVLFFSARAAAIFMQLVQPEWLGHVTAIAISKQLQEKLLAQPAPWQSVLVPIEQSEEGMLSLLTNFAR
ncbi:MAG: uroporphyrinogen-III synthase [Alphaproteobacteria bacterium]